MRTAHTGTTARARSAQVSLGFTLIELLVTVAVAAILLAAASPSFSSVSNGNRLAAVSNDLVAALQTARMESLRRGQRVVVCRSADNTLCSTGNPWTGWIVFADADADNTPDSGEILGTHLITAPSELWVSPAISAGQHRVVFRPDALAYSNGGLLLQATLAICIKAKYPGENIRDINIMSGGQIDTSRRNGGGNCAAPGNP